MNLFAAVSLVVAALEQGPASSAFLRAFEMRLLAHAGYDPQLERCAACGRGVHDDGRFRIDPTHGTLRCARCPSAEAPGFEVAGETVGLLLALRGLPLADCQRQSLAAAAAEAAQITGRLLEEHLQRPLRSLKMIAQLNAAAQR